MRFSSMINHLLTIHEEDIKTDEVETGIDDEIEETIVDQGEIDLYCENEDTNSYEEKEVTTGDEDANSENNVNEENESEHYY